MDESMISIFNGKRRGLDGNKTAIFAKLEVGFRKDLHHFKGARLAVFLAIALHANEDGWAWPSVSLLAEETGYNPGTIQGALNKLCGTLVDGKRLLLRYQPRAGGDKRFQSNRYLIFPTSEEIAVLKEKGVLHGTYFSVIGKPDDGKPIDKEEPSSKNKHHDDSDSLQEQDPAIKVPANGNGSQPAPPPEDVLAADERGFLDELAAQSEERNAGVPAKEPSHWSERQKDSPWLAWHPSKVRARGGVSAEALQKIGWLIERRTSLVPVDRQWSGWLKALLMIYQVAQGDMRVVETGIKATWAKDDKWKPGHAQGFVKEVQKARALKTKRASERAPVVGTVYE